MQHAIHFFFLCPPFLLLLFITTYILPLCFYIPNKLTIFFSFLLLLHLHQTLHIFPKQITYFIFHFSYLNLHGFWDWCFIPFFFLYLPSGTRGGLCVISNNIPLFFIVLPGGFSFSLLGVFQCFFFFFFFKVVLYTMAQTLCFCVCASHGALWYSFLHNNYYFSLVRVGFAGGGDPGWMQGWMQGWIAMDGFGFWFFIIVRVLVLSLSRLVFSTEAHTLSHHSSSLMF
ncbi:hypothetical protein DFH27DRAFT_346584 [Peziza echinospora]|nr:hypothetical protein DFH27DRAFT_346584 [Peziza echinospora]